MDDDGGGGDGGRGACHESDESQNVWERPTLDPPASPSKLTATGRSTSDRQNQAQEEAATLDVRIAERRKRLLSSDEVISLVLSSSSHQSRNRSVDGFSRATATTAKESDTSYATKRSHRYSPSSAAAAAATVARGARVADDESARYWDVHFEGSDRGDDSYQDTFDETIRLAHTAETETQPKETNLDGVSIAEGSTSGTTLSPPRPNVTGVARPNLVSAADASGAAANETVQFPRAHLKTAPTSLPTLKHLEADLQTKIRAWRGGRPSQDNGHDETPGAYLGPSTTAPSTTSLPPSGMNRMEDDILAKSRPTGITPTTRPGAVFVPTQPRLTTQPGSLNEVERDMLDKRLVVGMGRPSAAKDGGTGSDTAGGDSSERVPSSSSKSTPSTPEAMMSNLDARIAYKTGIPTPGMAVTAGSGDTRAIGSANVDTTMGERGSSTVGPGTVPDSAVWRLASLEEQINYKTGTHPRSRSHARSVIPHGYGTPMDTAYRNERRDAAAITSFRRSLLQEKQRIAPQAPLEVESGGTFLEVESGGTVAVDSGDTTSVHTDELDHDEDHHDDDAGTVESENRIVIAVPVLNSNSDPTVEDDSDEGGGGLTRIPSAVAYDPNVKSPRFRSRRFRIVTLFASLAFLVVVGCVVVLLVGGGGSDAKNGTTNETESGSSVQPCERCDLGIQEELEALFGTDKFNDSSSPYYMAMDWIMTHDTFQLVPSNASFVQRYALATFYFDTHQNGREWKQCNQKSAKDRDSLCLFSWEGDDGPIESYEYRWLGDTHECTWAGLECNELYQMTSIKLLDQQISGTLPTVLTHLPNLQEISFNLNEFEGTLPTEFGGLTKLTSFSVRHNLFTGPIPSAWANAQNLVGFNIGSNLLTGTLPYQIKNLKNVIGLYFYDNLISGTFPTEVGQMTSLFFVRMQRNFLTGRIPSTFGDLPRLLELWLYEMPLTGTIPSELGGKPSNLVDTLDLRLYNTQLEGTIPEELWDITISRLDLYGANLSGTLSSAVGMQASSMRLLRLSDNHFSGTLPSELDLLTNLRALWLDGNDFIGTVPTGVCDLKGETGLIELSADCLSDTATGKGLVGCECCDVCCNPDTEECDAALQCFEFC